MLFFFNKLAEFHFHHGGERSHRVELGALRSVQQVGHCSLAHLHGSGDLGLGHARSLSDSLGLLVVESHCASSITAVNEVITLVQPGFRP